MRAAKVDQNQAEIVDCLRLVGFSVHHTHTVAAGFPDLCVGKGMRGPWLIEVKRDEKARYTPDQLKFRQEWKGPPPIRLNSVSEALEWAKTVSAEIRG